MKITYYCLIAALFCLLSCKKSRYLVPADNDAAAPSALSSATVQNLSGAADIYYTTPNDANILYIQAVYKLKDGTSAVASSSVYNNVVRVEGFADTLEHQVQVYVVGKNEKKSTALTVTVKPKLPPYLVTRKLINMQATFGGLYINYINPSKASLTLNILVDSSNVWVPVYIHYTKIDSGFFSVRGLPIAAKKYAIFVKDRWNNYSDTLVKEITPIFEEAIPKTGFAQMRFTGELWQVHPNVTIWTMNKIWDDLINNDASVFHTSPQGVLPLWFSFDMGVKAKLSRFKFFSRANIASSTSLLTFAAGDPLHYEIWGSNNPNADGTFDSWTKLMDVTSIKPSGNPLGTNTTDDNTYGAISGQDFDFPVNTEAFRYIRIKIIDTWGSTNYFYISELSFWGQRQ